MQKLCDRSLLASLSLWVLLGWSQLFAQAPSFWVQGHRGARGHWPENSIIGCQKALSLGIQALEIDLVISGDSQVVVSHEPWFNPDICVRKDGKALGKPKASEQLIYHLPYDSIRRIDCGCIGHPGFAEQESISVVKPLLRDLFNEVEAYRLAEGLPEVVYNLEIKSLKPGDGKKHPAPTRFVAMVWAEVLKSGMEDQVMVQSFDLRILREFKRLAPDLRLGLLVADPRNIKRNLKRLGFDPDFYNPWSRWLRPKTLRIAHERGIQVVVWTANEEERIAKLIEMGVDGIITDYPDRVQKVLRQRQN